MKIKKPWYHFYLKLLTYVSRFLTMFFITAITIIIFYYKFTPNARPLKDVQGIHYKGQTNGIITSAEAHTGMRQNKYGTRITTDYFLVTYQYQINDVIHTGSDQLNNTPVIARKLASMKENGYQDSVLVKYDVEEVERSVVKL